MSNNLTRMSDFFMYLDLCLQDTHLVLPISARLTMSTSVRKALPGKLDIKRHSPSTHYLGKPRDVNKRSQSLAR